MQKIVIVAATESEIAAFYKLSCESDDKLFEFCITGVGMVATAFQLTKTVLELKNSQHEIAGILNVGIAGSFDPNIRIGTLIEVESDRLAEFGAQDDGDFIPIEKLGLGNSLFRKRDFIRNHFARSFDFPMCKAITVNTVHGNEDSIQTVRTRFEPEIESMEGAAAFYVAEQFKLPVQQIRAISNYVEKRNRESWNIPLAISNLNNWLHDYFYKDDSH